MAYFMKLSKVAIFVIIGGYLFVTWGSHLMFVVFFFMAESNLAPPVLPCDECNIERFKHISTTESATICKADEEIFLLVAVPTTPNDISTRDVIRHTWGNITEHDGRKIKLVFILGFDSQNNSISQLQDSAHGDLLLVNVHDSYYTLTEKVLMTLHWVATECTQARYILKTDTDTINILRRIVEYLSSVTDDRFVGGKIVQAQPSHAVSLWLTRNKFYVSPSIYPYWYTPAYCQGSGYILSQQAIRDILIVARNQRYLFVEDMYITGICRSIAGLSLTHIPGMHVTNPLWLTPCHLSRWGITGHRVTRDRLERIWPLIQHPEHTLCHWDNLVMFLIGVGSLLIAGLLVVFTIKKRVLVRRVCPSMFRMLKS